MIIEIVRKDGTRWVGKETDSHFISSDELADLMLVDSIMVELEAEDANEKNGI